MYDEKLDAIINECIKRTLTASTEEIQRMQDIYDHYANSTENSEFEIIYPNLDKSNISEVSFVSKSEYKLSHSWEKISRGNITQGSELESTKEFYYAECA